MEPVLLFLLALVLVAAGLAGLLFPVLPGAPLLFLGLLVAAWAEDFTHVGTGTLVILGVLAVFTYIVDFMAGIFGAKRFGASPRGMIGAGIGAVFGIFLGWVGVVLGPFVGAIIGELSAFRGIGAAGRAGVGATVGLALGAAVKIAVAFSMLGIFAVARLA